MIDVFGIGGAVEQQTPATRINLAVGAMNALFALGATRIMLAAHTDAVPTIVDLDLAWRFYTGVGVGHTHLLTRRCSSSAPRRLTSSSARARHARDSLRPRRYSLRTRPAPRGAPGPDSAGHRDRPPCGTAPRPQSICPRPGVSVP